MAYEGLLLLHPTTLDYIPALATHWQISQDRRTFRFRINPNARWSDGMPVVAEDVVATWKLAVDKTLQDPARSLIYSNFEQPVAESKYIVSVRAKTDNWQNFMYFCCAHELGGLFIYPAHALKGVNGEAYIKTYNYKMLPGSGPYMVVEADVDKGNGFTMRRRQDYWAANHRRNIGLWNFDRIQQLVVRDENLEFEMFKKGDLDYYVVARAQMWVEEFGYENMKVGNQQRRKIFNNQAQGIQGVAMNTRREPFNDLRVRKALRHLFNRESIVEKLMYNEYFMMNSLFPSSVYENPGNEKIAYDPQTAVRLLAEAGWRDRDSNGRLVRNGRPLTLELVYGSRTSERHFTLYQEDLRRVGVTLNLRFTTWESLIKLLDDRAFDMVSIAYTGEIFPRPEANWLSSLADQKNNNNITAFKNARADAIMNEYQTTFDFDSRQALLRELDGILTNEHHWILQWTAPYERLAYWNKFGQPRGYITRFGDYHDPMMLWWFDPDQNRRLEASLKGGGPSPGAGPIDDQYWLEFARTETQSK
jgi:microcin C transport system substrate-binding protein